MLAAGRFLLLVGLLGLGGAARSIDSGMVLIPAGPALLGGTGHSAMSGPMRADVAAFWIDRFEVTNTEYRAFAAATGREPPMFADDPAFNGPDLPVTGVSWHDATAYWRWARKRLPREIEWEKAARGTDGRIYPWGDSFDAAWAHLSGETPIPVGGFARDVSPYGVRGMVGNVSEWVADTFLAGGFCGPTGSASSGAVELSFRAFIRGASWAALPHMAKSYHHLWDHPDTVAEFLGFRCVRTADAW